MRLRISALVFAFLFSPVLGLSPAYAHETPYPHDIHVRGIAWFDDNLDGIRQPNEPMVPSSSFLVHAHETHDEGHFSRFSLFPAQWTDDEGHFVRQIHEGSFYAFYIRYSTDLDGQAGWDNPTHIGCTGTFILPDFTGTELVVNVRLIRVDMLERLEKRPPYNWPVANGHFFSQSGYDHYQAGYGRYRHCDAGFAVTNSDGIPFWDTWQRLGLENVGYPISHRYMWRGFVTQAFQKAIMQWQPGKGVFFVNIFDELHDANRDNWVHKRFATPYRLDSSFDERALIANWEKLPEETRRYLIAERRLALLDDNPAIKERYYAAPDPLLLYGLPTSRVEDMGNHYAIRTQKTVLQQWKEDVPWAKAGEVTIANGGSIAKEVGGLCIGKWRIADCTHWFFPDPYYFDPIQTVPRYIPPFGRE